MSEAERRDNINENIKDTTGKVFDEIFKPAAAGAAGAAGAAAGAKKKAQAQEEGRGEAKSGGGMRKKTR